jgi:hypothetical protein
VGKAYEDMTVDELDALNAEMKGKVNALNEERQKVRAARDVKVEAERAQDRDEAKGKPGIVVGIGTETTKHEGEVAN